MTQAAVSYQVKSLEERLGAPLFVRERGRARLTPLGTRLLPALVQRVRCHRGRVRQPSRGRRVPSDHHHDAHLREHLAGLAARRIPDGASRSRGPDDDQQRARRPARRATPTSRSAPAAATGKGSSSTACSNPQFTPMASPDCIASGRAQAGPDAPAGRHARTRTCINPSDDWWQQWFCRQWRAGRRSRAQPAPAFGSKTRPMRAMRRWPARASPC